MTKGYSAAFREDAPGTTGAGYCCLDGKLLVFGGQTKQPDFVRTNELFLYELSKVNDVERVKRNGHGGASEKKKKKMKTQTYLHNCKRLVNEG